MSTTKKYAITDAEIDRAIRQGKAYDRTATKITEARYDMQHDMLVAHLSTGAVLTMPRSVLPGLKDIAPDDIGDATVGSPGYSIWFDRPDTGIWIDTLLEIAIGPSTRSRAARTLGQSTSPAKAIAVRANGAKGGRPRKRQEVA
jgi:hypothetical protein